MFFMKINVATVYGRCTVLRITYAYNNVYVLEATDRHHETASVTIGRGINLGRGDVCMVTGGVVDLVMVGVVALVTGRVVAMVT